MQTWKRVLHSLFHLVRMVNMQEENTNYFISGLESASESRVGIVRLELVKEERCLYGMKNFTSTKEAAQMAEPLFAHADREMVVVLSLDVRLKPDICFFIWSEYLKRREGRFAVLHSAHIFLPVLGI